MAARGPSDDDRHQPGRRVRNSSPRPERAAEASDGLGLVFPKLFLRLYPPGFREAYREPILQSVRDGLRESRGAGARARFAVWRRAVLDLAAGGARMRLRSLTGRPEPPDGRRRERRSPAAWLGRQVDVFGTDARHSFRALARAPWMTAAAIATLAVAIGLTALTFSVVYATTLRELPYERPDRLVEVWHWGQRTDGRSGRGGSSFAVEDLGDVSRTFSNIGQFDEHQVAFALANGSTAAADASAAALVPAAEITPGLFELLGVRPQFGRPFAPEDAVPGAPPTVILGHQLWVDRFDGAPGVLGRTVSIDNVPHTVIGVMPEGFAFSYYAGLWVPWDPTRPSGGNTIDHGVVARLRDGVSIEQANRSLELLRQQLQAADVRPFNDRSEGWQSFLEASPLGWERWDELGWAPFSALLPVGLALLVACANIAGLLLARGVTRRHEMTLRAVVGGSRWRLARQLLTESVLIAGAAGLLGLLLSAWSGPLVRLLGQRVFDEMAPFGLTPIGDSPIPGWLRLGPDPTIVLFVAITSALAVATIGLVPAREASRADLGAAIRAGGYGATAGRQTRRWHDLLAILQLALTVILIVAASLAVRSAAVLASFDSGMDTDRVLEVHFNDNRLGPVADEEDMRVADLKRRVEERIAALPEVESVSSTWFMDPELGAPPARPRDRTGSVPTNLTAEDSFIAVASPATLFELSGPIFGRVVGPDHFRTLGLTILHGRGIEASDTSTAPRVAVVSESTARIGWPGEDPLGHEIRLRPDGPGYTVVGIVEDRHRSDRLWRGPGRPDAWRNLYVAAEQVGTVPKYLLARAAGDTADIVEPIRRIARELDPTVPLIVQRLNSRSWETVLAPVLRWSSRVLAAVGISVLALSALGIFGVVAYTAARRTREMGLRAALGADRAHIVRAMLRGAISLTIIGIALGTLGALALGKLLAGWLYGVSPFDPAVYAAVVSAVAVLALLAGWLPARRAAAVDPAVALRED